MILIGLVVLIAVLMALAVPRIWRKLTVPDASYPDASYRAGSPPQAQER
jgi:uncharacterized protein YjeT (DUF2065 family)